MQAETKADADSTTDDGKRRQGNAHDVHQQQEGHAEDHRLGGFGRQLPDRGAHGLFVDIGRRVAVRPSACPEQQATSDQAAHDGHDRELDVAQIDLRFVQEGRHIVKDAQGIEARQRHKDVFGKRAQEGFLNDLVGQRASGKEQKDAFAKGNHRARSEQRPRDLFADRGQPVGQKRQEQRQEDQDKAARFGDDRGRVLGGFQNGFDLGGDDAVGQNGCTIGKDEDRELRPGRRRQQPVLRDINALLQVALRGFHQIACHVPLSPSGGECIAAMGCIRQGATSRT